MGRGSGPIHVHGGVDPLAEGFDHELLLQVLQGAEADAREESPGPAPGTVDAARATGLVAADEHVDRRRLAGQAVATA